MQTLTNLYTDIFLSKLEKHEADQLRVLLGLPLDDEKTEALWKRVFDLQ